MTRHAIAATECTFFGTYRAACACGWLSPWCPTRDAAIDANDRHLDDLVADIDDMLRDKYEPWVD